MTGAFPPALESYTGEQGLTVLQVLARRASLEPLNVVASVIFLLAILHTFAAPRFLALSHRLARGHGQDGLPATGDAGEGLDARSFEVEILHFLGLAIEHVARETRQEGLPDVLNELATVRARREELLAGNPTTEDLEAAAGYELQELDLLRWIAEATSELIDHRP